MNPAESAANSYELNLQDEPPEAAAIELKEGAGFGIRVVARLVDLGIGYLMGYGAGIATGFILAVLQRGGYIDASWQGRIPEGNTVTLFLAGLAGVIAYHTLCEWIHGATLGKLICRIRVVRQDGRPCGLSGALIRSIAYLLDSLFFGLIGYHSMEKTRLSQRNGDVWGRTAVIKTAQLPASSEKSPALFILGLFLGTGAWMTCMVTGWLIELL
jgi:uncharacterized RDD family membrane protein YckC